MENEKLWVRCREGDTAAENALIERILPAIRFTAEKIRERYSGIMLEKEDLIQEALIGILRAIETYDPIKGNLFKTYAQAIIENAMMDHVRKCFSAIPFSGRLLSLDAQINGSDSSDDVPWHEIIYNKYAASPEQVYIRKETITEVQNALQMISDRERTYLHYRYGFWDNLVHTQSETAAHFHLSKSRAKHIEKTALDNVRLELVLRR